MTGHSAADSASGYLYQCRYALLAALRQQITQPGLEISIECFDDVAFSESGAPIELIQTKHSAKPRSMSDMAAQFWKTIGIWTKHIVAFPADIGRIKFVFVTTANIKNDTGLSYLRASDGKRDVNIAHEKLLAAAAKSADKDIQWAIELFTDQTDAVQKEILGMVEVLDGSSNVTEIQNDIGFELRHACRAEHRHLFIERLEGWWFSLVVKALTNSGIKLIPVLSIDAKIDDLREEFGPNKLPIDYRFVDPCQSTVETLEGRSFIEQLRLIDVGPAGLKMAVLDYFRAREQRSRWTREGLLRNDELNNYGRQLTENWGRRWGRIEMKINATLTDEQLIGFGQILYDETTTVCMSLREMSEPFLSHGSYHILADRKQVGWHPNYQSLIVLNQDSKDD